MPEDTLRALVVFRILDTSSGNEPRSTVTGLLIEELETSDFYVVQPDEDTGKESDNEPIKVAKTGSTFLFDSRSQGLYFNTTKAETHQI